MGQNGKKGDKMGMIMCYNGSVERYTKRGSPGAPGAFRQSISHSGAMEARLAHTQEAGGPIPPYATRGHVDVFCISLPPFYNLSAAERQAGITLSFAAARSARPAIIKSTPRDDFKGGCFYY